MYKMKVQLKGEISRNKECWHILWTTIITDYLPCSSQCRP